MVFWGLGCLDILAVLLFSGVVWEEFLLALSSVGSVLAKEVWICCFLGVFAGSFSYVLIWCWVFVRNFVLLILGFDRNYLPEEAPEIFPCQTRFLRPSLIRTTEFWRLLVELFPWKGSLPPSQGRVLP